uniref:Amine oxidase domain-containing protein n=1 Tax=Leptocylindrus danicus TaxID=163516 RepID=A0A7S2P2V6_9STRA
MKHSKSNYPDDENLSLLDYLQQNHQIPDRMMGLAIAGYSNTAGCSDLNEISYAASRAYERHWDEHETEMDVRLNSRVTMSGVVDILLRDIHVNAKDRVAVRLNARVTDVDYSSSPVQTQKARDKISDQENNRAPVLLTTADGATISADACIISVPVTVLQDGDITFRPSLPQAKVEAFQMVGMRNAVKLMLKFRTPLWPAQLQSVVCADSVIPEMWFRKFDYDTTTNVHVAVCYLMDQAADALVQRGQEEATKHAKLQLQRMFRITAEEMEESFVDSVMFDWGAHDSIRGGYSFPKVGIRPLHFQDMADSVADRLYFCGEHTHLGAPITVQAAM